MRPRGQENSWEVASGGAGSATRWVPWRSRLQGEKAVRELGYRPLVTYEEALAETERHLTESGLVKR